ncbi:MAG: hypothetical protein WCO56_22405, partial [Verrucomicrobiota bacterium]
VASGPAEHPANQHEKAGGKKYAPARDNDLAQTLKIQKLLTAGQNGHNLSEHNIHCAKIRCQAKITYKPLLCMLLGR